jgi:hypothetical protein
MWKVQNLGLQYDAELNTTNNNVADYFKLLSDDKATEIHASQYGDCGCAQRLGNGSLSVR